MHLSRSHLHNARYRLLKLLENHGFLFSRPSIYIVYKYISYIEEGSINLVKPFKVIFLGFTRVHCGFKTFSEPLYLRMEFSGARSFISHLKLGIFTYFGLPPISVRQCGLCFRSSLSMCVSLSYQMFF